MLDQLSLPSRIFRARGRKRWRRHLPAWLSANAAQGLKSATGEGRVIEVLTGLAPRLSRALALLDRGPSVLDERSFAIGFQHALSWIAFQDDITAKDSKLRAFCDITASLAVFDLLLREIAAEFLVGDAEGETDIAIRLATSAGSWREPLIAAGQRKLRAGLYDEAVDCARRALNILSACPSSQRLLLEALSEREKVGGAISDVEKNGLADLRGRFCSRPFEALVSGQATRWNDDTGRTEQVPGGSYLCDCPSWLPFHAGNIVEADSPDAVWNSGGAQEIRRSILDGDFSYCSRTLCPLIANGSLPRRDEVTAPHLRRIIDGHETRLQEGPRLVALAHDSSCNLACPSCRTDVVMADKTQNERLDGARDRVILPLLAGRQVGLLMTTWGDPFASRHYRSILEALKAPEFDGVWLYLLTNGLGLTPHVWKTMPHLVEKIVELNVSVDAATKQTYENVRRPGKWETIRENLAAMGALNKTGAFRQNRLAHSRKSAVSQFRIMECNSPIGFGIAFVVQSANFREIPTFVRLAEEVGADMVLFQRYYNLGHEASSIFAAKNVASPAHPEHEQLRAILKDPIMQSPLVSPLFLSQLDQVSSGPSPQ